MSANFPFLYAYLVKGDLLMKMFNSFNQFKKIVSFCKTCTKKKYIHHVFGENLKTYNRKLKETKKANTVKGYQYTKKRYALHIKIANKFLKEASAPENGKKAIAVLVGGGTASGKTTLRKNIVEKRLKEMGIRTITVDPDEIKEYIPEYQLLKKKHPKDAARLVHKESIDISEMVVKKLIRHRKHFVHEGTMAKTQKYKKLIKTLKNAEYDVYAYIVDIPVETARQRAAKRAKITGRTIPPHIIENTHRLVPNTVEAIKNMVDKYYVYDNQNGLVLIASNNFVEPALYDEFLKKRKQGKKNFNKKTY